ncbi:ADP-glyceromanno-heptose 6-epimerase [Halobacteriovorax sp.]|uniref:ADP-glyceromanno-heptose 6-epimerase n=1 Tax=Halobacteriovorax sp. TaxID=2020862 RepID=UPI003AF2B704
MILVTGGAGFIGSVLVAKLNEKGREDIIIVDRFDHKDKWKNLRGLKYAEYFHADEFFDIALEEVHKSISFIYHMGACSSTTEMDMDYLMVNNVGHSKYYFELASDLGIPFIYASSAATYGDGELGYEDNEEEIGKLRPLNPYGYSKQLFDEWALKQETKPKHWFGLKFFNVYGPNEYHKEEMRSLVHKAFGQINETGQVKLFKSHKDGYEDGKQLRDFVYVKDVVDAMIELSDKEMAKHSGIYNIGTGRADSFLNLVNATFKAMGLEPKVEFIDMPMHLRKQYQYYTQADMEKFRGILPNFDFRIVDEGVEDYVKNHLMKDNPYVE